MAPKPLCLITLLTPRRIQAVNALWPAYHFSCKTLLLYASRVRTRTRTRALTGCETKVSHKLADTIRALEE